MTTPTIQVPSIIIPTTGAGTLTIADAAEHVSISLPTRWLQEKTVLIYAVAAGGVTPLNAWIEISSTDTPALYIILGVPIAFAVTGAQGMVWTAHSEYSRLILQCPAWVAGSWTVYATFEGKGV